MSSGGDGDRHREHLGVSRINKARRRSISSTPEHISHDTYLFVVPFGTADPQEYYPNYRRLIGASFTSQALPSRRYEDLPL
ncbi:hypothetical protein H5410_045391 [Solanum commersonii]|uniref:Uncharacterized protein n=1 Tax=Solanum commersonii TaxID=4109 RepID=A0A9J5XBH4_SOLCO|nr:hypothetical protein H5410_045391 [Solanum commersonii]